MSFESPSTATRVSSLSALYPPITKVSILSFNIILFRDRLEYDTSETNRWCTDEFLTSRTLNILFPASLSIERVLSDLLLIVNCSSATSDLVISIFLA